MKITRREIREIIREAMEEAVYHGAKKRRAQVTGGAAGGLAGTLGGPFMWATVPAGAGLGAFAGGKIADVMGYKAGAVDIEDPLHIDNLELTWYDMLQDVGQDAAIKTLDDYIRDNGGYSNEIAYVADDSDESKMDNPDYVSLINALGELGLYSEGDLSNWLSRAQTIADDKWNVSNIEKISGWMGDQENLAEMRDAWADDDYGHVSALGRDRDWDMEHGEYDAARDDDDHMRSLKGDAHYDHDDEHEWLQRHRHKLREEKWVQKSAAKMKEKGTEGSFGKWCDSEGYGDDTQACINHAAKDGTTRRKRQALWAANVNGDDDLTYPSDD